MQAEICFNKGPIKSIIISDIAVSFHALSGGIPFHISRPPMKGELQLCRAGSSPCFLTLELHFITNSASSCICMTLTQGEVFTKHGKTGKKNVFLLSLPKNNGCNLKLKSYFFFFFCTNITHLPAAKLALMPRLRFFFYSPEDFEAAGREGDRVTLVITFLLHLIKCAHRLDTFSLCLTAEGLAGGGGTPLIPPSLIHNNP